LRFRGNYKGFFRTQESLVLKDEAPSAKAVLYLFRVVMTGLHLLRTREVVADIRLLNDAGFRLSFIAELIERKMSAGEKGRLAAGERDKLLEEARRLEVQLEPAAAASGLPEAVENLGALDDFLVPLRLAAG